ncbi:MAG: metal-dependent hydrolase [Pseudomonadota bacterium]
MKLTWLGHAAYRLEVGAAVILIDPFLTGNSSFEGDVDAVSEGCTHVVLSHGHMDHVGDTEAICNKTGAQLVSNYEIYEWMSAKGIENVNPGNPGGTLNCGDFSVTLTHANHSSAVIENGVPIYLGAACGLVFEGDFPTLYHMGDTNMFSDMALIHEFHQPKIGIVPVGDRFTMGGRQAAIACQRYFEFETIIPCHYGTFPVIDQTPDKFIDALGDDASKVTVMEVGTALTL